jgi:hypothetical protein
MEPMNTPGTLMSGPIMPPGQGGAGPGSGGIDDVLIPKILALPQELKQSLLQIITDMETPSKKAPVSPGLEGNLTSGLPM